MGHFSLSSLQMSASDARVLVLGGSGFIGRNLVHHLVVNDLASYIRVADKVLPQTAYLDEAHQASFDSDKVEFMQANLTSDASIAKVFTADEPFTFVFNLAGETKYSQPEGVYAEKITGLTTEVSTAQVYDGSKKVQGEDKKIKPWTQIATYKMQAEEALAGIDGLNYVIVRPVIVYGPGDVSGISPRVICGAVYQQLGEKMTFLWTKDLAINTVHVRDVVRALWHLTSNGESGEIYNLADKGDTKQGTVNSILETIFGIETNFAGKIKSNLARVNLAGVTEGVNEKHLKPWSDLCRAAGIDNTPLTPYLDQELLYNNHLAVDGSKIESTGFTYDHPEINEELVREQIAYFTSQNIFPESTLQ